MSIGAIQRGSAWRIARTLGTIFATSMVGFGLMGAWNVLANPSARFFGHLLDDVMWFGSTIAALGGLVLSLLWLPKEPRTKGHLTRLSQITGAAGLVLGFLLPCLTFAFERSISAEGLFIFLVVLALFPGPGLVLLVQSAIFSSLAQRLESN